MQSTISTLPARALILIIVALIPIVACASDFDGEYSCVNDDNSEIYDNEDDNGHHYFDLSGDLDNVKIRHKVIIDADTIKMPSIGVDRTGKELISYDVISIFTHQVIALDRTDYQVDYVNPNVLFFTKAVSQEGRFGYALASSFYAVPRMRKGEGQSVLHLQLGHCVKIK